MILGLDISTTMVGVALIDQDSRSLLKSEAWDISKCDSLYEKAELIGSCLYELRSECYDMRPTFINVNTARTLYGLSFPRGTKGPQRKKMVIEAVVDKEKTNFKYEMARGNKNYKRGTDDRADAVVIARAGEFFLRNKDNKGFLTEKIVLLD